MTFIGTAENTRDISGINFHIINIWNNKNCFLPSNWDPPRNRCIANCLKFVKAFLNRTINILPINDITINIL